MKLTGRLKEQVEQAKTKEEAKDLIAQVGMELTDEEMDQVAGGGTMASLSEINRLIHG